MTTAKQRVYIRGSHLSLEEDETHEFKGHREVAPEDAPPWVFGSPQEHQTRQAISRNLNAFLNTGRGGVVLCGVDDHGRVMGLHLTRYQKDHVLLSVRSVLLRYRPAVPSNRYRVSFVPVVGIADADQLPTEFSYDVSRRKKQHLVATSHYCWCDADARARSASGIIPLSYVIEIEILPWPDDDKSVHPFYLTESGQCYTRRQASITPLTAADCVRITRQQAAALSARRMEQMALAMQRDAAALLGSLEAGDLWLGTGAPAARHVCRCAADTGVFRPSPTIAESADRRRNRRSHEGLRGGRVVTGEKASATVPAPARTASGGSSPGGRRECDSVPDSEPMLRSPSCCGVVNCAHGDFCPPSRRELTQSSSESLLGRRPSSDSGYLHSSPTDGGLVRSCGDILHSGREVPISPIERELAVPHSGGCGARVGAADTAPSAASADVPHAPTPCGCLRTVSAPPRLVPAADGRPQTVRPPAADDAIDADARGKDPSAGGETPSVSELGDGESAAPPATAGEQVDEPVVDSVTNGRELRLGSVEPAAERSVVDFTVSEADFSINKADLSGSGVREAAVRAVRAEVACGPGCRLCPGTSGTDVSLSGDGPVAAHAETKQGTNCNNATVSIQARIASSPAVASDGSLTRTESGSFLAATEANSLLPDSEFDFLLAGAESSPSLAAAGSDFPLPGVQSAYLADTGFSSSSADAEPDSFVSDAESGSLLAEAESSSSSLLAVAQSGSLLAEVELDSPLPGEQSDSLLAGAEFDSFLAGTESDYLMAGTESGSILAGTGSGSLLDGAGFSSPLAELEPDSLLAGEESDSPVTGADTDLAPGGEVSVSVSSGPESDLALSEEAHAARRRRLVPGAPRVGTDVSTERGYTSVVSAQASSPAQPRVDDPRYGAPVPAGPTASWQPPGAVADLGRVSGSSVGRQSGTHPTAEAESDSDHSQDSWDASFRPW